MTISHLLPHLSWLTNLAARFTRTTAEAEDCAIIALERIAPRLEDFKTDEEARAFLVKTARNAALDAHKHTVSTGRVEARWQALQDYPDDQVESAVRLQMVIAYGIPQLPVKMQEVANLWAEGMDSKGIAAVLGLSEKTVRNMKGLIIKDLKKWVRKCKLQ